jgi:hypothetical protein
MAAPPRLKETPSFEEIRAALRRLCTNALRTEWILKKEGGLLLLGLDCVRDQVTEVDDPTAYSQAFRSYLSGAVSEVDDLAHRAVLEIVLGTGDKEWENKEWRRQTAKARRSKAGERFRPEGRIVSADTIRQIYEGRAIHELAQIVWKDERKARGESTE